MKVMLGCIRDFAKHIYSAMNLPIIDQHSCVWYHNGIRSHMLVANIYVNSIEILDRIKKQCQNISTFYFGFMTENVQYFLKLLACVTHDDPFYVKKTI